MEDNGKMRTSGEPNKISIARKVLTRAIQNVFFIEFEPLCQKLYAFMSNLPNHSPNMVMSRDPGFKFRIFLFFALFDIKFQEKLPNFGEIG